MFARAFLGFEEVGVLSISHRYVRRSSGLQSLEYCRNVLSNDDENIGIDFIGCRTPDGDDFCI